MAKISDVSTGWLRFANGVRMTSDFESECCEWNYANFAELDTEALNYDFDTDNLRFEACEYGFRFGDCPERMFFVPCYSEQNGWYSNDVDVYLDGKKVLNGAECEIVL